MNHARSSSAGQLWTRTTSRRRFLMGAGGVLGLLLVGCSEDNDPEDATPSTGTTATAASTGTTAGAATANSGYPRTVAHSLGETELAAAPQRIVLLSDNEPLDSLLQLGAQPVHYLYSGGYIGRHPEWLAGMVEGIPFDEVVAFDEYDLEMLASQRPDLIIGVWLGEEIYNDLSQVAPTVSVKEVEETTWQEIHRMLGAVLAQEALAEEQIAETEAALEDEAARVEPYRDRSVAVAYEFADQLNIHGDNSQISKIVKGLGLEVVAPGPDITVTSIERWQDVAAADLLLSPSFSGERMDSQLANPLFLGLPAVQNGSWVILDPEMAQAGYMESALSTKWLIPKLADAIIAAAEGQGEEL